MLKKQFSVTLLCFLLQSFVSFGHNQPVPLSHQIMKTFVKLVEAKQNAKEGQSVNSANPSSIVTTDDGLTFEPTFFDGKVIIKVGVNLRKDRTLYTMRQREESLAVLILRTYLEKINYYGGIFSWIHWKNTSNTKEWLKYNFLNESKYYTEEVIHVDKNMVCKYNKIAGSLTCYIYASKGDL